MLVGDGARIPGTSTPPLESASSSAGRCGGAIGRHASDSPKPSLGAPGPLPGGCMVEHRARAGYRLRLRGRRTATAIPLGTGCT
jgi:hypothetical protein